MGIAIYVKFKGKNKNKYKNKIETKKKTSRSSTIKEIWFYEDCFKLYFCVGYL